MGERLKMARHITGMSMRALAERTAVSAMAISKYECDQMVPSSEVLVQLTQLLDVLVGFFLRPVTAELTAPAYLSLGHIDTGDPSSHHRGSRSAGASGRCA